MARSSRRGDDARHTEAGFRARARAGRAPRSHTASRRGPRPHRGGEHLRHRSPHPALGSVVVRARQPAADAGPRALRHRRRGGEGRARGVGGRLRVRGEPRHLRGVLPLPHREGAHVRAHADPRRRSRRGLRRLRRDPCFGHLAERPREAASAHRVPPGAVRQRRLRHVDAGSRRTRDRGPRLRAGRALRDRHRAGVRGRTAARVGPRPVSPRPGAPARRGCGRQRRRGRRRPCLVRRSRTRAWAWASSSRCPAP